MELSKWMTALREDEFPMLSGVTYLDHAGTTLYCRSQLDAYHTELATTLYGNPHSHNESSELTSDVIEESRDLVLSQFNTDRESYSVVFTAGCTASLKLLGESFPWSSSLSSSSKFTYTRDVVEAIECGQSVFCYLEDDHTSVLGIREVAMEKGAGIVCFREEDITHRKGLLCSRSDQVHHLIAFPAQSNFSGRKYPLQWVKDFPSGKVLLKDCDWLASGDILVLLDAASLVSTSPLDLSLFPAHFVTISFYKMFGFPTGLGALLVRKDCADLLQKSYFGGGTVAASISRAKFHVSRPIVHERLEDGTVAFLDIVALRHGFAALGRLGHNMEWISSHTFSLAKAAYELLKGLKHYNGHPVCVLYHTNGFSDPTTQGPIVNFNLSNSLGAMIGFSEVDKLATVWRIQFRTGCFCNTGACQSSLGLTDEQMMGHIKAGHVCGDSMDLIQGTPTGSIRVSFGYMSTMEDVDRLISFIKECFLEKKSAIPIQNQAIGKADTSSPDEVSACSVGDDVLSTGAKVTVVSSNSQASVVLLENIFLYPVKSCACLKVTKWPVGDKGLLYDREWMIVKQPSGNCLTQKEEPKLCLIRPKLDLDGATLSLTTPGHPSLVLPIIDHSTSDVLQSRVCGDRISTIDCGDDAARWITSVLGGPKTYRLIQQHPSLNRTDTNKKLLSCANQAQFLSVSVSSVQLLCQKLNNCSDHLWTVDGLLPRFRPNLVISGCAPFDEDNWQEVHVDRHSFVVTGRCTRCQMICVDQSNGLRNTEPLVALRQLRNPPQQMTTFGIYLTQGIKKNII